MSDIKDLKDSESGAAAYRADAELQARRKGGGMPWLPGLILIALGVIFLLGNFTDFHLNNWWALFILIPAFGSLGNAWRAYQGEGRFTHEARGSLIGGLVLLFVAAAFLFSWNWAYVWPALLIIAGIGALLSGLGR